MYTNEFISLNGQVEKPFVYPGVLEAVRHLTSKGKIIAIVSSHPKKSLIEEAKRYGIDKYISIFEGDIIHKPEIISKLLKYFNYNHEQSLYVGDCIQDWNAGKEIGIVPVIVYCGYQTKDFIKKHVPYNVFSAFPEVAHAKSFFMENQKITIQS